MGASLAGAAVGVAGVFTSRSRASIRFIGRRSTIVSLFDTGTERVVFVLGDQDDGLLEDFVGLTTIGNSRIDLVIATHRVLATRSAREHLHIGESPAIAIQTNASLPPIRGEITSMTSGAHLTLGKSTTLRLASATTNADHPDFVAMLTCHRNNIILATNSDALRLTDGGQCNLLVIPGRAEASANTRVQPQLLVSNSPNLDDLSMKQMQVFRNDPQIVQISNGSISVRDDQLSS